MTAPETGAAGSQGVARPLLQLDADTPQPTGASAATLTGVARAGVNLSYVILGILSGSIVLLLAVLLWLEADAGSDVRDAYRQAAGMADLQAQMRVVAGLERLADDLRHARDDPGAAKSDATTANARAMTSLLDGLPEITGAQKAALAACNPAPSGPAGPQALEACLAVLDDLRDAAVRSASDVNGLQVAQTVADRILAHRQAILAFWLQAAQLILLNLLLPLLTALFGYIFGTHQAQRDGTS